MSGEHPKALTKAQKDTRGTAAIVENEFGEARPGLEVWSWKCPAVGVFTGRDDFQLRRKLFVLTKTT